ncbi:hypothetical protein A2U01_0075308 [Trifolium medium]|uniref:Uncharacterized protein n=1 Tax=Trifolium medium TaxID=97028 RepID=A0A392SYY1_9FABA|nr:hypothetical protein [Trifolium medium]
MFAAATLTRRISDSPWSCSLQRSLQRLVATHVRCMFAEATGSDWVLLHSDDVRYCSLWLAAAKVPKSKIFNLLQN